MTKRELKFVEFARKFNSINGEVRKNVHISLLTHRNKIISAGVNCYRKSHPKATKIGNKIHSEIMTISKFPHRTYDISKCTLINIRLAKCSDSLLLSKPCEYCEALIQAFDIKQVIYSTPSGFVYL